MPALIFDCDGVLAETEFDGHLPAFNDAFAEFGLPVHWSADDYAVMLRIAGGKERIKTLFTDEVRAAVGLAPDADPTDMVKAIHLRKTDMFAERAATGLLPPRPGIARLIREALDAGWPVAIASTAAERSVRAVLTNAVGEADAARCLVYAGDIVEHKKPAPDIYLLVLSELGLDPSACLVIEDSENGVRAAVAAGLVTLVTFSHFTRNEDFTGAALVANQLGDPGDPLTVIDAPAGLIPSEYVTLADCEALLATTDKEHA